MNPVVSTLTFLVAIALLSWPLGRWLARAVEPNAAASDRGDPVDRLDRVLRRLFGGGVLEPQGFGAYVRSLLAFNAVLFVIAFIVLATQQSLPLNPDGKGALDLSLVFHTVASFVANTNLQHYSGEQHLSYLAQLTLMWLQFVSAATGIAALTALARSLAHRPSLGNFWRDAARVTVLVLLPLAAVAAIVLLFAGVPMTFDGAATAHTLEGPLQVLARGPVAAFVAIKQLGTNGGGWFGPNSAHPFEDPSAFTALIESVAIVLIPMACVWLFGHITGRVRHAATLFAVMFVLFAGLGIGAVALDSGPNPALHDLPVAAAANLEGKELRFGEGAGALWAVATTATSNGSVAAMHDSLNPLAGAVPLAGMWLNCAFGGVGVGLINLILYVIVAVFIAGMMVGRTPEYLGRKLEAKEMRFALLALLLHPLLILGGTAWFAATSLGAGTISNPGSHGLTQILYEFSSAAANNGSGFEGLGDGTAAWNIVTGVVMLLGRYLPILLPLAIGWSLARKKPVPETSGTLRTDTPLFGFVLLGAVFLIGALLFLPAAVLGPVAEHLALASAP